MNRWEVGSEFDWSERFLRTESSQERGIRLPSAFELFSTGTACLFALQRSLPEQTKRIRIHLPSLYCIKVAAHVQKIFDVCWYRDLPTEPTADFESLNAQPGDIVMAFNLYGIRTHEAWQNWHRDHQDVTMLEDHSHDPFSDWAQQSLADYAFASLRKTLPIPDGGMLWSPKNHFVRSAWGDELPGAAKRLKAMKLKHRYLVGEEIEKDRYRKLEIESQNEMGYESGNLVSDFTARHLHLLDIAGLRAQKMANIRSFLKFADNKPNSKWKPLFKHWDAGTAPLNAIVQCQTETTRDQIRAHLIKHNIFTAIHWLQPHQGISSGDEETIELTRRVLTIPLDARYDATDVRKVFEIMSAI
jgi:hypothetical protein